MKLIIKGFGMDADNYSINGTNTGLNDMQISKILMDELNLNIKSFEDLLIEADKIGNNYENDYANEISWFEFDDESVAVFDGQYHTISILNN